MFLKLRKKYIVYQKNLNGVTRSLDNPKNTYPTPPNDIDTRIIT